VTVKKHPQTPRATLTVDEQNRLVLLQLHDSLTTQADGLAVHNERPELYRTNSMGMWTHARRQTPHLRPPRHATPFSVHCLLHSFFHSLTDRPAYHREVAGSTPGQFATKCLLLGLSADC